MPHGTGHVRENDESPCEVHPFVSNDASENALLRTHEQGNGGDDGRSDILNGGDGTAEK